MNISVTLSPELRLEQALKEAGIEDPATVTHLTVVGTITDDDFEYFREKMIETLQKLDIGNVAIKENGIGFPGFSDFTALTSVILPDSLKWIDKNAFEYCKNLTSITIPDLVIEIGSGAFSNCTGLTSVTIPVKVSDIRAGAFSGCKELISFVVHPDNLFYTSIDGVLFSKDKTKLIAYPCKQQGGYVIPESVIEIGESAFEDCKNLTSITIPESVFEIGKSAFYGCGLISVTVPASVTKIDKWAFSHCENLTSVAISGFFTKIENLAFYFCQALTTIAVNPDNSAYTSENGVLFNKNKTELIQYPIGREEEHYDIPDSVTKIGFAAFAYCNKLKSVTIPKSVTKIEHGAFYVSELTSVIIPDGVTEIGDFAFFESPLKTVSISNSVTKIGEKAFYLTRLSSIAIPASVVEIGNWAWGYIHETVHPDNPVYTSENGVLKEK